MDYTKTTLGELLSSNDSVIKRHATGILKKLQRKTMRDIDIQTGEEIDVCPACGKEYDMFGRCDCCNDDAF